MVPSQSQLDKFFEDIKGIPSKNAGGCLLFCYLFWLWLKKNGFDTSTYNIIQIDWDDKTYLEHNKNWIKNKEGNPQSSLHFFWSYEGKTYDADGPYDVSKRLYGSHDVLVGLNTPDCELVSEFCVKALNNGGWNPIFNRNASIEEIKEIFDINLDQVKK